MWNLKALSTVAANPWWPVMKLGLVLVVLSSVWIHGCSAGAGKEKKAALVAVAKAEKQRIVNYEVALGRYQKQAGVDQKSLQILGLEVMALEDERRKLQRVQIPVVVRKEVVPNAQGKCIDSRLSDAFGLCASAAVSGSPADARACEAAAGDGKPGTLANF